MRLNKRCRKHGSNNDKDCYFCLGKDKTYLGILSREEILLENIFGGKLYSNKILKRKKRVQKERQKEIKKKRNRPRIIRN